MKGNVVMKNILLIVMVLILAGICLGGAATVTTFSELEVAIHDDVNTPIHLNAATFTMTEDILLDHNCIIDNVFGCDVTIDGNALYTFVIQDAQVSIGESGVTDRIIFTNGYHTTNTQAANVRVANDDIAEDMVVNFHHVDFTYAYDGTNKTRGMYIGNTSNMTNMLTVNCIDCTAQYNSGDGISLESISNEKKKVILNWIDSDAHHNGYVGGTPTNDRSDGLTSHDATHVIQVTGGSIYNNCKGGVSIAEGVAVVYNCHFYENAQLESAAGCHGGGNKTSWAIINCRFTGLKRGVYPTAGSLGTLIYGCTFHVTGQDAINIENTSAVIMNNSFHKCNRAIWVGNPSKKQNCFIVNNIISQSVTHGIYSQTNSYDSSMSGYNAFYGSAVTGGSMKSTDITLSEDPFMDADNDNFTLKPSCGLINAGLPTIDSGFTTLGAWQRKQVTDPPGDLDDNDCVDFIDLAILGDNWLKCNP